MIFAIAAVVIAAWACVCRKIHLDLVDAINRQIGKMVIPRSFTMRFFSGGCLAIVVVALASIVLR